MITPERDPEARRGTVFRIALTTGAVAGTVCLLSWVAALLFSVTPLVFRSGSMEPSIGTGALALARTVPAVSLEESDVVSVDNELGERVTHRVVAVESVAGNTVTMRLRGDANATDDDLSYTVDSADRVFFHIEKLGYVVTWLSGPAAVFLGGALAGVLITIAVRPEPRHRTPRHRTSHTTPVLIVAALTAAAVLVPVPRAGAAVTDAAAATTGAFGSRSAFVPRINQTFALGSYVTCSAVVLTGPDRVTLAWRHLGTPYRYRILLRDNDGRIWRTWDVTPSTTAAGDIVTYTLDGSGLPSHNGVIWQYTAEIHTVLPSPPISSGAVSGEWRGIGLAQRGVAHEDLFCSITGEDSGTPAYVPPPGSVECVSQPAGTQPARATLTWPHLGTPYTYRLTFRDETSRNVIGTRTVTSVPSQSGGNVSTDVAASALDVAAMAGGVAVAEVRTVNGTVESSAFAARRLTVTPAAVSCAPVATVARQGTPSASEPSSTSTVPATAAPSEETSAPAATPATTTPSTTSPPTTTPSTTSPVTTTPPATSSVDVLPPTDLPTTTAPTGSPSSTTTVPAVSPPEDTIEPPDPSTSPTESTTALSPPTTSTSGYRAQLMDVAGATMVVVTDPAGTEITHVPATTDDRLHWLSGSDELWILGTDSTSRLDASTDWAPTRPDDPIPPEITDLVG